MSTVTIIIPTFNRKTLVQRAVNSCLGQVDEIVVVDDGSTDGTHKIEWNKKVRYIRLKENKGVHVARNIGMYTVKTDYFLFLDSDDELYENVVPIAVEVAEKKCALVVSGLYSKEGKKEKVSNKVTEIELSKKIKKQTPKNMFFALLSSSVLSDQFLYTADTIEFLAPNLDSLFYDMVATMGDWYHIDSYFGIQHISEDCLTNKRKKFNRSLSIIRSEGILKYFKYMENIVKKEAPEKYKSLCRSICIGQCLSGNFFTAFIYIYKKYYFSVNSRIIRTTGG